MRKLASIKQISDIQPIPERDRIELAIVDGWQIIVKKDEYKIGDKTIFVEIDSILPDKPEFEFLRPKHFRIRTMKLKGVLSQGICFPLSILPPGNYELEDDVTDILGITKYTSDRSAELDNSNELDKLHPIARFLCRFKIFRKLFLGSKEKGFPTFISKTDETRVQNIPSVLKNKELKYVVREKVDGQSGTFVLKRVKSLLPWRKNTFEFIVCSRNQRLWHEDGISSQWFVAKKYKLREVLEKIIGTDDWIAIQGECISPSVQGNKYKVTEPDLFVFNLITTEGKVDCIFAETLLEAFGIKWCPLIATDFVLPDTVNELLDYATGTSKLHNTLREGLVFRNYERRTSFKAVSPDFLIKNDE